MKVALLRLDGLDVAMLAASVCVSEDMPTVPKPEGLTKALESGHDGLLEHIIVSFAIEGVSRVTEVQLVRHRMASYAVQSGRYCTRDPLGYRVPESCASSCNRIDGEITDYNRALRRLDGAMIKAGIPAEDRRMVYPQGMATNIVMTCNLREFSHICALRLCVRAQGEIRELVDEMACAVIVRLLRGAKDESGIRLYRQIRCRLEPQCRQLGYCPEIRGCGLRPHLKDLRDCYNEVNRPLGIDRDQVEENPSETSER